MISAPEFLAYGQPPPVDYPISDLGPDQSAAQVSEVIEIGSGSGAGVLSLLEQLPGAHVVCLEPDDIARAGLAWRLHDHPERDRVSILPLRLQDALALGPVDLVVAHTSSARFRLLTGQDSGGMWRVSSDRVALRCSTAIWAAASPPPCNAGRPWRSPTVTTGSPVGSPRSR